ncbi:MAG: zinc ribbon domain-containing protein [Candidatus Eremiobacterota bacterium]
MFCPQCGTENSDSAAQCRNCWGALPSLLAIAAQSQSQRVIEVPARPGATGVVTSAPTSRAEARGVAQRAPAGAAAHGRWPKCMVCGYVGAFLKPPRLAGHEILIFLLLLCFFGAGFIYLMICLFSPKPQVCPRCKANNGLITYDY